MIKHKKILLIDDSSVEAILLNHAIIESGKLILLESRTNSLEALNELMSIVQISPSLQPDLILLDLNMPGFNGIDFLNKLRKENILQNLPTIVFTSSDLESDKLNCLEAGANTVIVKPSGIVSYKELITTIYTDWLMNKNENK